jgi:hypothetical protein
LKVKLKTVSRGLSAESEIESDPRLIIVCCEKRETVFSKDCVLFRKGRGFAPQGDAAPFYGFIGLRTIDNCGELRSIEIQLVQRNRHEFNFE